MKLLTATEMAEILRVSPKTFGSYINKFGLPYYGARSAARFDPDKVLRAMENPGVEPSAPDHRPGKLKSKSTLAKKPNKYREMLGL